MAYCVVGDLLHGSIPLPTYLSVQKFVDDAADEIDSKLGFIYDTPINVQDTPENPVVRPVRLLLKRLNAFLATGRLLLAVDAGHETDRVHAYGYSLIQEAQLTLEQIAQGQIKLEGVPVLTELEGASITAPLISNLDTESNVEAFYDRIANPDYVFGLTPKGWVW